MLSFATWREVLTPGAPLLVLLMLAAFEIRFSKRPTSSYDIPAHREKHLLKKPISTVYY